MAIKADDLYQAVCTQPASSDFSARLAILYGPLIEAGGISLYLVLYAESRHGKTLDVGRLCNLTKLSIVQLEKSKKKLESFQLLKTYLKNEDGTDLYRFELYQPLTFAAFMQHEVLGRLYLKEVGTAAYIKTSQLYINDKVAADGFKDVSSGLDPALLQNWNETDEKTFKTFCHDYSGKPLTMPLQFDIKEMLAQCTELMFPHQLRTPDNLRIISEMGTIFCIDTDSMRKMVSRSIDFDKQTFDIEKLHSRCLKAKSVQIRPADTPYDMPPLQFLLAKQQGTALATADKKLLEYLQTEMEMDQQVINVMIESILKAKNNRLDRAYVEKVAASWKRQQIDTVEKALALAKQADQPVTATGRKSRQRPDFAADSYSESNTDFEELNRKLFKKGE